MVRKQETGGKRVIQGSLQRHLKFGIMSTADSGIKLAEKVSCIELGS